MVTYSALSICHFSLPLCMPLPACVSCHCKMEHIWNYILSPTNPPCGLISLFRPVWLQSDAIPWKQTCRLDPRLGFALSLWASTKYRRGVCVEKRKRPSSLLTCLLISNIPPGLTGLLYSTSLQRKLCSARGEWQIRKRKLRLKQKVWWRERSSRETEDTWDKQSVSLCFCKNCLAKKKKKNTDSPESSVSTIRQI